MYDFIVKRLEILKNTQLTDEEKNINIKKLIESYNLPRYCCRAQLLSFKDIINEE
jgi:DNA-directed RNA polymerase subunit N (RpoN/RPB10)